MAQIKKKISKLFMMLIVGKERELGQGVEHVTCRTLIRSR